MQRICVIGPCGAGKSTFARALADKTALPLVHLDQHYWRPGWVEPEPGTWPEQVKDLIDADRWIIDGNYHSTMETRLARADTVFFLDYKRRVYLWRAIKRVVTNYGCVRHDSAPECPERFDWEFMAYLWRFGRDSRPKTIDALDRFRQGRQVIVFSKPREAAAYLDSLPS